MWPPRPRTLLNGKPDMHSSDPAVHHVAELARVLAEPKRVLILLALMNGRAYTATELALMADIAPSTASSHLHKMREQGFIACVSQGKHRYFRLSSADIAQLLEQLLRFTALQKPSMVPSTPPHLRQARTCYQHLAGEIAVTLAQEMVAAQWLQPESYDLTELGHQALCRKGVPLAAWETYPQQQCTCLDWSERQFHIGKRLGKALLCFFMQQGYFDTVAESRELVLTRTGKQYLLQQRFTQT